MKEKSNTNGLAAIACHNDFKMQRVTIVTTAGRNINE